MILIERCPRKGAIFYRGMVAFDWVRERSLLKKRLFLTVFDANASFFYANALRTHRFLMRWQCYKGKERKGKKKKNRE